jgi:hypothetical protein
VHPVTQPTDELYERYQDFSEDYLVQAVDAILDAADPQYLYRDEPLPGFADDFSKLAVRLMRGSEVQKRSARLALMLAAFACEAYANIYIDLALDDNHRELLDRQTTVKKLLIAPKLAGNPPLFELGREPLQTIQRLFRLRNLLVHSRRVRTVTQARPKFGAVGDEENLIVAAQSVTAVAQVAVSLDTCLKETQPTDWVVGYAASVVIEEERYLVDLARRAQDFMPAVDADLPRDILAPWRYVSGPGTSSAAGRKHVRSPHQRKRNSIWRRSP